MCYLAARSQAAVRRPHSPPGTSTCARTGRRTTSSATRRCWRATATRRCTCSTLTRVSRPWRARQASTRRRWTRAWSTWSTSRPLTWRTTSPCSRCVCALHLSQHTRRLGAWCTGAAPPCGSRASCSPYADAAVCCLCIATAAATRQQEVVSGIQDDVMPHHLCEYLFKLANQFSDFYSNCRVVGDPKQNRCGAAAACDACSRNRRVVQECLR